MSGDDTGETYSLSELEAKLIEDARESESIPQEEAKKMIGMD